MANNIVASMSATIDIDKKDIVEKTIASIKEAQATANGHQIIYKFTGNDKSLKETINQLKTLSPEINFSLVFDNSLYKKKLAELEKYSQMSASAISKEFKQSIESSFKSITIKDILSERIGTSARNAIGNLDKMMSSLNATTSKFQISKVTTLDDIVAQVNALKEMQVVLSEIKHKQSGKNNKVVSLDGIDTDVKNLATTIESRLSAVYENIGTSLQTNAGTWITNLKSTYLKEFSEIENYSRKMLGDVDNTSTELKNLKSQLIGLRKTYNDFNKAKKYSELDVKNAYNSTKLDLGYKESVDAWGKFSNIFKEYIKYGGDVANLNKEIVASYNSLNGVNNDFVSIDKLNESRDAILNNIEAYKRLNLEYDKLKNNQVAQTYVSGNTTAGVGSITDQTEEISLLQKQLDLIKSDYAKLQDSSINTTSELNSTKTVLNEIQSKYDSLTASAQKYAEINKGGNLISTSEMDALNTQVAELNNKLVDARNNIESQSSKIKKQTQIIEEEKVKYEELRAKHDEVTRSLEEQNQLKKNLVMEKSGLQSEIDGINAKLKLIDASIKDCVNDYNHFIDTIRKHDGSINYHQVATDALNKEYTLQNSELKKNKAALYYGIYRNNKGGTDKLLQGDVDVSTEMLERYNSIIKEVSMSEEEQRKVTEQLVSVSREHASIVEKITAQNKVIKDNEKYIETLTKQIQAYEALNAAKEKNNALTKEELRQLHKTESKKTTTKVVSKTPANSPTNTSTTGLPTSTSIITEADNSAILNGIVNVDNLRLAVDNLKSSISEKTKEIYKEEIQMRDSSSKEVSSIQAINREITTLTELLNKLPNININTEGLANLKLSKANVSNIEKAYDSASKLFSEISKLSGLNSTMKQLDAVISKLAALKGIAESVSKVTVHIVEDKDTGKKSARINTNKDEATELLSIYNNLEKTLKRINNLSVKKGTGTASHADELSLVELNKERADYENEINQLKEKGIVSSQKQESIDRLRVALAADLAEKTANLKDSEIYSKNITAYQKASSVNPDLYVNRAAIEQAKANMAEFYNQLTDGSKKSANEIKSLNDRLREQIDEVNRLSATSNLYKTSNGTQHFGFVNPNSSIVAQKNEILGLLNTLNMGKASFETFTKGQKEMLVSFNDKSGQIKKYRISLDDATGAVHGLYQKEQQYLSGTAKWFSQMRSKIGELARYVTSITIVMRAYREAVQGFQTKIKLNDALTEMRKVSSETVTSLKKYQESTFNIAKNISSTAETIQNSTADWMRIGENLKQASESAKVTGTLMNVSEFEDISAATDSLVAMSQAYKELDKIDIVDKMNNVGE